LRNLSLGMKGGSSAVDMVTEGSIEGLA
jgi:hypothetical protein